MYKIFKVFRNIHNIPTMEQNKYLYRYLQFIFYGENNVVGTVL